ncbi:MAG: tyrosine--tRNA ligase [Actinomycetota bacterium]|nr:tyrosine--tRNA ligase [Actinomycetota bacterium]
MLSLEKQLEIILNGLEEVLPLEDLRAKLKRAIDKDQPLTVKYGVDPTSPDLHLGHAVPLRKLRELQDLGHKIILLIGDFTAQIGDPSLKSVTRPQLSADEVRENAITYTSQAFKILDETETVVDYNGRWFNEMNFSDVVKLTSKFTVARLLERDDFAKRYRENSPIGLHEFLYPVMQGYDSVMLKSDIEIGGTDQTFNMLAGRDLQKLYHQEAQVVLTLPILEGTDGVQKMSKSLGNQIGLTDPPNDMFGKVMSVPDSIMIKYFRLASTFSVEEIDRIEKGLKDETVHPAEAKRRLASNVVQIYHGREAGEAAEAEFDAIFKLGDLPSEIDEIIIDKGLFSDGKIWIVKLITHLGFAKTNGEARRLIEQGGVSLGDKVISSTDAEITVEGGEIIRVGKRRFARLVRDK